MDHNNDQFEVVIRALPGARLLGFESLLYHLELSDKQVT